MTGAFFGRENLDRKILKSPEDLVGEVCFEQLGDVQNLFLNPDKEVAKIQEILTNKKPVLADEVF